MFHFRIRGTRVFIMLVVLLAQFVLLMLFDLNMRFTREIDVTPTTFLTFIESHIEKPHLELRKLGGFKSTLSKITIPAVTLNISPAPGPVPGIPRTIDLEAATKQFTRDYLKHHSEMAQPLKEKSVPHLFPQSAPTPANVYLPGGKLIQWSNSRCYVETVDGTLTDPAANGKHLEPICKRPRPNKHMFDHLKPEYLKKPADEICTKNMVGCNHSSSSSANH